MLQETKQTPLSKIKPNTSDMPIILFIVFGIINAIIANQKGFSPVIWFFAAGLLGLIVVLFMPSANAVKESNPELCQIRTKNGNIAAILIFGFALIAVIILLSANNT